MADQGVDIRIRTTGARRSAREVDDVGNKVDRLGRRARGASGSLRVFTRATTSAAGGLHMAAGAALYGGAAFGGLLLIGIKRSTDAWNESRKVAAQTGAVIRSTGGVANVTATDVDELAQSISRKAGVDDEAIQSGENLLLTFKKVRNEAGAGNDVFNRATRAAIDLSAAGFGSIESTSKQLGKALNDPLKGITALSRAGVTFTQGQKDQIASLVETGDLLRAQRIILREVESQVTGSAAAQATPIDRLKVSWENVQETIGKGVSPVVDRLATKLDKALVNVTPEVDALGDRLGRLMDRKDLSLEDKLSLAGADVHRTARPFVRALRREFDQLDLGDKLGQAVDDAAPHVADAAGRLGVKAAGSFVHAWWDAGPWGKLITAAFLGSKLGLLGPAASGVFGWAGRKAAGQFRTAWRTRLGRLPSPVAAPTVPITTAPPIGAGSSGQRTAKAAAGGGFLSKALRLGKGAAGKFVRGGGPLIVFTTAADALVNAEATSGDDGRARFIDAAARQRREARRPRARASHRGSATVVHTHVHLNRREIARATNRVNSDDNARGRRRDR